MAFFDNLKNSLKQKWLQFFQINLFWITLQMEAESVYTPDGGRRPSSYLILGVVTALEPQLTELMLAFSQLNPDPDALIDVLELNFAPELLLGDRFNLQTMPEELSGDLVIEALIELDPSDLSESFDEMTDEVVLVQTADESVMVMSREEAAVLADAIAFEEMADEMMLVQTDDKSVIALDLEEAAVLADAYAGSVGEAIAFDNEIANQAMAEETSPQESMDSSVQSQSAEKLMPSADDQTKSNDVLSDVWVEDPSVTSEQLNSQTQSSTQKQSEDDEISRLFPNL